jgi:hypothetical protein
MMEAERASETLDCSSILTRLVAREDFILPYSFYLYLFSLTQLERMYSGSKHDNFILPLAATVNYAA